MRALVLTMMAERDSAIAERDTAMAERDELAARNERLHALLLKLRRMQFGRKSERLPVEQLALALEDLETAIAEVEAEAERDGAPLRRERAQKRHAGRGVLPAHLPRIEVVLPPPDTVCPCCKAAMIEIGEDRSERLDVIPTQYRVLVTRRPKFVCRSCVGVVVQQAVPPRLIEGGLPTESTVADVVVSRFADHQPLYRQGADDGSPGDRDRPLHASVLGWLRRCRDRPGRAPAEGDRARLGAIVCRRNRRASTRSWPWSHQARLFLDDCT